MKPRIVAELSPENYNYIIRVENLQDDFSAVLDKIGISQVREVPRYNVSTKEEKDLDSYYPPHLRKKAVRILGPMMDFMGYTFPDHWEVSSSPVMSQLYFNSVRQLASFFWDHVNYQKETKKS